MDRVSARANSSVDGEDQESGDDEEEDEDDEDDDDEEMDEDEKDEDVEMDEKPKAHDPNDLSAFKMDEYDEESTGVGESRLSFPSLPRMRSFGSNADNSNGCIRKRQGTIFLQG